MKKSKKGTAGPGRIWNIRWVLDRPVLENTLVGTLTGTLVGVFLKGYLSRLAPEPVRIEWVFFTLAGLLLGLFSGLERRKIEALRGRLRVAEGAGEEKRGSPRDGSGPAKLQADFIAHVSHEFRNPLAAMKEFVSLLLDGVPGPVNPRQTECLNRVAANLERCHRIINNFVSAIENGGENVPLRREKADLRDLVIQVRDDFQILAAKKSVSVELSLSEEPLRASLDSDRIVQVLANLVGNALKFTSEGDRITIGAGKKAGLLEVWVEDTGVGIPPAERGKIFNSYRPPVAGRKPGKTGRGLGLAISREIVQLHRGRIWVESRPEGRGSRFIFSLPLDQPPGILLVDTAHSPFGTVNETLGKKRTDNER